MKAVEELGEVYDIEYFEAFSYSTGEEGEIDINELIKQSGDNRVVDYRTGEEDYHCTHNFDTMKDRYDRNGNSDILMQKYLRKTKIKNLENK